MWWYSRCTPASSTTKTGRHDIAEILLKEALSTINQIKLNPFLSPLGFFFSTFHLDKKSNKHSLIHNLFLQTIIYTYGKGAENPIGSVFFYKKGTHECYLFKPDVPVGSMS
jgi:hypothetical protein